MKRFFVRANFLFATVALIMPLTVLAEVGSSATSHSPSQAISKTSLTTVSDLKIVPTKEVCMVNDVHFGRPQIPVTHNGKTYYGCCDNCKKTLGESSVARTAIDPVTKRQVDKAKAVIAARSDGSVVYFESQKTFEEFSARKAN